MQRLNSLQRRIPLEESGPPKLAGRLLKELENALEEVRVAQEQLVESRNRMEVLQAELASQYRRYWQLFDDMPQPYVVTKPDSTILEVNRAASELFNVSQRFLVGKTLSVFVGQDRVQWLNDVRRAAAGGTTELAFRLRPRERAAIPVTARIAAEESTLRWVIAAVQESAQL
ncbi:MAG TPA: PAS domain-containing protein [Vicinamibacterales bacterium]|nr:PAS domain-containing protein [Vicinamibacterales bacterium]